MTWKKNIPITTHRDFLNGLESFTSPERNVTRKMCCVNGISVSILRWMGPASACVATKKWCKICHTSSMVLTKWRVLYLLRRRRLHCWVLQKPPGKKFTRRKGLFLEHISTMQKKIKTYTIRRSQLAKQIPIKWGPQFSGLCAGAC